jgi:Zn-finger protein
MADNPINLGAFILPSIIMVSGINAYRRNRQKKKAQEEAEKRCREYPQEYQHQCWGEYQYHYRVLKEKIQEELQMKRKVKEAMNNLPIHEQENIKNVLKKIEDDDGIEILKNINIDEIIKEFLNNK